MRIAQGWLVTFIVLLVALPAPVRADVQYVYDGVGRVVQVIAPDGSSAQYVYDVAGNISAIKRFSANQLALSAFNPSAAAPGAQVTIHGSGFSLTPANNVVSFNGAVGTVTNATPNRLTVQVPTGAATGPISVTLASATVSSVDNFVVTTPPTISSFAPAVVDSGATVTVSGSHFDAVPNATQVTIANVGMRITSISNTQLAFTVPSSVKTNPITVATPYGDATSATKLIVIPPAIGAANVGASGEMVVSGAAQSLSFTPAKYSVFSFDAMQGQYLSVQVASLTTVPPDMSVYYVLYAPGNAEFAAGWLSPSSMSIHLPRIATTGTHLIAFVVNGGPVTAQFSASLEQDVVVDGTQAPLSVTTSAGQLKRFVINGDAGEDLGVGISGMTLTPSAGNATMVVGNPQGGVVGGSIACPEGAGAVCGLSIVNIPQSGDYLATVGANSVAMNFTFRVTPAVTGTLPLNAPFDLNLPDAGQFAMLSFVATQGQTVNLNVSSIVTTPAQPVWVAVFDPTGAEINSGSAGSINLPNLDAGTYTVQVSPYYGGVASAQLLLSGAEHRPTDATSANFSTSIDGQALYFTFDANAGDNIGVGVSNLTMSTGSGSVSMAITRPSGYPLNGTACNASPSGEVCGLSLLNLPETGRYQVTFTPGGQATMSFALTLSHAVNNALTIGSPFNLSLPAYGQFAMLTFTASAGQSLTLDVNSVATDPSQPVWVAVYDANNETVTGGGTSSELTLNLSNLAAGTYKIQLSPYYGGTASATVRLY